MSASNFKISFHFNRYKKLWARHQKNLRGMPDWKMALACKDSSRYAHFTTSYKRVRSTSGSSSRSLSESFTPEIIHEESEEELAAATATC